MISVDSSVITAMQLGEGLPSPTVWLIGSTNQELSVVAYKISNNSSSIFVRSADLTFTLQTANNQFNIMFIKRTLTVNGTSFTYRSPSYFIDSTIKYESNGLTEIKGIIFPFFSANIPANNTFDDVLTIIFSELGQGQYKYGTGNTWSALEYNNASTKIGNFSIIDKLMRSRILAKTFNLTAKATTSPSPLDHEYGPYFLFESPSHLISNETPTSYTPLGFIKTIKQVDRDFNAQWTDQLSVLHTQVVASYLPYHNLGYLRSTVSSTTIANLHSNKQTTVFEFSQRPDLRLENGDVLTIQSINGVIELEETFNIKGDPPWNQIVRFISLNDINASGEEPTQRPLQPAQW